MSTNQLSKLLIIGGIIIAAIGAITLFGSRFKWLRIGRLPGDIVFEKDNFNLYFPITTMILISILLSFLLWVAGLIKK